MQQKINLGDTAVDVFRKDIKNVHLSVYPPTGAVRISAPRHMKLDAIRVFAISKLSWIRKQQKKIREQERETEREFLERESHYVWGKRYLLSLVEEDRKPSIELTTREMILTVRPGTGVEKRQAILDRWHRAQLRKAVPPLVAKWEPIMGVKVAKFFIQRMKTKWGSCNHHARSIRLNTDLAKKPPGCLEYIVVHELVHLIEPTHNDRFQKLMQRYMPNWRHQRETLNRLPVRHEKWSY